MINDDKCAGRCLDTFAQRQGARWG